MPSGRQASMARSSVLRLRGGPWNLDFVRSASELEPDIGFAGNVPSAPPALRRGRLDSPNRIPRASMLLDDPGPAGLSGNSSLAIQLSSPLDRCAFLRTARPTQRDRSTVSRSCLESDYCHITSYIPTRWTIRSWLPVCVSTCQLVHLYVTPFKPALFKSAPFQTLLDWAAAAKSTKKTGCAGLEYDPRGKVPNSTGSSTGSSHHQPNAIKPPLGRVRQELPSQLHLSSSRTSPVGVIREADCGAHPRSLPRTPPLHPSIPQ